MTDPLTTITALPFFQLGARASRTQGRSTACTKQRPAAHSAHPRLSASAR